MSLIKRPQALRLGRPVWLAPSPRATRRYPTLSGRHDTDVAIVGGGMTGALIAHAFASAGVPCVVLEASRVGAGSTAASSALLLQEPDKELTELARLYGRTASSRIWQISQESVQQLIALLTRLRIACHLERRDAVYYATDAHAVRRLRREFEVRTRAGFSMDWLGPEAVHRVTGIAGRGAIRTRGSAQFDPYRACLGVMRAAAAEGAEIFEGSKARRIKAARDRVRIDTRHGVVEARRVIIATGYATPQFRPLVGRFRMFRTYVLATDSVPAEQREHLGLSDVMVWDTERPYHYVRWTANHQLLLGGGDQRAWPGQHRRRQFATATRQLFDDFQKRLPALTTIALQTAWEGLFAITPDSLPYIGSHRRYPQHWFALGYGGNGMTFAFLAARLLLERWQDGPSGDHALFEFGRMRRS